MSNFVRAAIVLDKELTKSFSIQYFMLPFMLHEGSVKMKIIYLVFIGEKGGRQFLILKNVIIWQHLIQTG